MAAVKVINHTPLPPRQPKDIPLPPSPADSDSRLPTKKSKKGKGKEKEKKKAKATTRDAENLNTGEQIVGEAKVATLSQDKPWTWTSLTNSSTSSHPPIFTKDGGYFFSIVGSSIKIHSTASGKVLSTLPGSQDQGHSDVITSAILSAKNAFQLITASLDGTIKIWDFLEGVLLYTLSIEQPIHHICAHEKINDHIFVSTAKAKKKEKMNGATQDESCVVLQVSLKPKDRVSEAGVHKSSSIIPIGKTRATAGLAVSASGAWLIAVAGHKAYVASISALKSGFTKYVSPDPLTCLSVHPTEDYFATGDEKGVVRLWYCLSQSIPKVIGVEKRSETSIFHWHAHAISSVAFSTNGAYLLSGGEESVLVIWQLHTGKKEFVPRVGSPIKSIVVSRASASEEYLLGLADASYAFISSATLKLSRVYARIKLDPAVPSDPASSSSNIPLAVHAASATLILPSSHPSSLQSYSPSSSSLVAELEVSPSNRVSRRDDRALEPSRVELAVISATGDWMATIDHRKGDETFRPEIYLKIWWWDKKAAFWSLNTRIDRPHGLHKVTSVSFSPAHGDPSSVQLITTGDDHNVKAWRIQATKDKKGGVEVSWTNRSTFTFRQERPKHGTWSPDGSLLAVSFDSSVAMYDPFTNILQHSFCCSEVPVVSSSHFIGPSGHYLAVIGGPNIALWDVVTQSVRWRHRNPSLIHAVVPNPSHDSFAIFYESPPPSPKQCVKVFSVQSSTPALLQNLPFKLMSIAWYPIPTSPSHDPSFSVVGVTHSYDVVHLGDEVRQSSEPGTSANTLSKGPLAQKRSLFHEMFGVSAFADVSNHSANDASSSKADVTLPWRSSETGKAFDAPAYLMPPMETLFVPLISSFLKLRTDDDEERQPGKGPHDPDFDMQVDPPSEHEFVPPKSAVVARGQVLEEFVPIFKEITGSPEYPFQSGKSANSATLSITSTPRSVKPSTLTPAPQKVLTAMAPTPQQASTPSLPAKAGIKRSRQSLG
ncbi:WD40 repeat-like protein [Leucogyrophana mollusca]|uniref:WD40 repeat-like protein n=1 Tax=Leucogyrophana mollusca TaxID=85980 RepID=A0ACB8BR16_9AGAM|nr:WD40 repeat-like protein [Leucogyrophana mollusca]